MREATYHQTALRCGRSLGGVGVQVLFAGLGCALAIACGASQAAPEEAETVRLTSSELFTRGKRFAGRGDLMRAEQYLASALRTGYPVDDVMPILVGVCLQGSRIRAALAYAEEGLERTPENLALRLMSASLRLALDDPPAAKKHLQLVLSDPDAPADAWYLMGQAEAMLATQDSEHAVVHERAAQAHFATYLTREPRGVHALKAQEALAELGRRVEASAAQDSRAPSSRPRSRRPQRLSTPPSEGEHEEVGPTRASSDNESTNAADGASRQP